MLRLGVRRRKARADGCQRRKPLAPEGLYPRFAQSAPVNGGFLGGGRLWTRPALWAVFTGAGCPLSALFGYFLSRERK